MSVKMERGTTRRRRDGSWEARNLSGTRDVFFDELLWEVPAEQRAKNFSQSVTTYYIGGGMHFTYPAHEAYPRLLSATKAGFRPTIREPAPF